MSARGASDAAERGRDRRALAALWLISLGATAAMWRHPGWLAGGYDWRYFESAMEAARRSVAWFGQWPLYNPYMCGGEPQLANPQSIAGSPLFPLVALFGTAVGAKLMLALFVGLGVDGAYRLARRLELDRTAASTAALAFGLCGWVAHHFAVGHVSFFGATLVPHALYCYLRAKEDLRWSIGLGAVMAVVLAQGGTSTAAMAAIALGAVAVVDAVAVRGPRPLVVLAAGAGAALGLGAYRLLPALQFAIDHPRHVTESDGQSPLELVRTAFLWSAPGRLAGHRYGLHEYAWRVGYLTWPLALVGLLRAGPLRRLAIAVGLIGAAIALGDWLPYGPWWLMRRLPVLRDLRVPSRYTLLAALGLALLAGAGVAWLRARLPARAAPWLVLLAVPTAIEGAIDLGGRLWPAFEVPEPGRVRAPFYQEKGHWSRMLDIVYQNRGDIGCDEEAPLTRALQLDEGPGPQVRIDDAAGTARLRAWSPNRLDLDVELDRPATLLVNLNWNEHWKSSAGEITRFGDRWPADRDGGRLAVRLPALRGPVTLRYRPSIFVVGLVVSALSLLAAGWVVSRRRRIG